MADIFIYSSVSLRVPRGNLEDDLEEFLGDGVQINGGGGGERGWNVDLEVPTAKLPQTIEKLKNYLSGWGVPVDTHFDVWQVRHGKEISTRYDVFDTDEIIDWVKQTLTCLSERSASKQHDWQAAKRDIEATLAQLDSNRE